MAVGAFASERPGDAEVSGAGGDKLQVALVMKDLVNPFFLDMKDGGQAAADEYGVEFSYYAPEKYAVENQIRIMEDLIQKGVDGIVICPIDGDGIVSGVERAVAAGIPVMGCNTRVNSDQVIGFAGIDHFTSGRALATYFVGRLNGEGNVVILEGTTGASSAIEMLAGVHEIIDQYPGINVLASTTAKYNRELAMQVMEDLLIRYPDIDAALCMNDVMALGAKEAILESGRQIMVGGINALPEAIEAVSNGEMEVTIDASGYIQGKVATELLCDYLVNGTPVPADTKIGVGEAEAIYLANLQEYMANR